MLLCAYPRDFRQRFSSEMVDSFSDQMWNEWQRGGIFGVAQVWRSAFWELLSIAVLGQLGSSVVIAAVLSFTGSSALFLVLFRAVAPHCNK
jgi:hypothetical protein